MKINALLETDKPTLSFEVFPPKKESSFSAVENAAIEVANLKPDYVSVTYGAGGTTKDNTISLASKIQQVSGVSAIAHLTCVGAEKAEIRTSLDCFRLNGIENVLALRGDRPLEYDGDPFTEYKNAVELVREIKAYGDFCIGGACYPEGHPEAANKQQDIAFLKEKVDAGCDFLTTQMFFDNNIFYNFLYRIREAGITVPVIPGIMPITRKGQVERTLALSGADMPQRFRNLVDHFGDNPAAMQQAGIAYATDQIIDLLANGIKHIHVYSMNNPAVAQAIKQNLSEIL